MKDKCKEKTPEHRRYRIMKLEARQRRNIDTIRRLRENNDKTRALCLLERENWRMQCDLAQERDVHFILNDNWKMEHVMLIVVRRCGRK